MRLSKLLPVAAAFLLAAVLSVAAARVAVTAVEDRSVSAVRAALHADGLGWAQVLGDGLQIVIEGEAPSEAVRFRAMSVAATQVDASRVIDNMSVAEGPGLPPPDFAIEILRSDSGISMIGLMPADADRAEINAALAEIGGEVTDLLETADHPVPEGWEAASRFAVTAATLLPRAKISVAPGRVSVTAMADSDEQKRKLETDLARQRPDDLRLSVDVSAPRPVISPFTARFTIAPDAAPRLDACAADTPEAQERILDAAIAAGMSGKIACPLALGAPSPRWGEVVAQAIGAVAELGAGTATVSDLSVTLRLPAGTEPAAFERVSAALEAGLPDVFMFEAVLPEVPAAPEEEAEIRFSATLSPEGLVQLRGALGSERMNGTAETYARARFGEAQIVLGTSVVAGLPDGWSLRVLAGIAALSRLENGAVEVRPRSLAVRGVTGDPDAGAAISRLLIEKLGQDQDFDIDVRYDEALDPIAALPTPRECIEKITGVTAESKITFDPGSADIAGAAQTVLDEIAEILRRCGDLRIEIAGYTDSQGREEMNQRLSKDRADAVVAALRRRRVPTSSFDATGYGEADPIADNDTEEGREANRRIEFRLIEEADAQPVQTGAEAGAGGAPDAAAGEPGGEGAQDAGEKTEAGAGASPDGGTDAGAETGEDAE